MKTEPSRAMTEEVNMKKINLILTAAAACLLMTGCTDAKAKLADSSGAVATVGKTTITKGDLYSEMFAKAGGDEAISDATKVICDKEVEVTDDMKEEAKSNVSYYSSMYGTQFTSYLEANNMTEDDYANEVLLPSLQADELPKKYVEQNWDALIKQYNPIQATVLTFSSEDDANAALSALKDGSKNAGDAAADNNSDSSGDPEIITINTTSYDTTLLSVIRSASPDDGWAMVPGSAEGTYYVARVESNTPEDYKDDVITTLSGYSAVQSDSTTYFFRKYSFHVYDIDLYNTLKTDHADALVQAIEETPEPEETASPAASASASAQAD